MPQHLEKLVSDFVVDSVRVIASSRDEVCTLSNNAGVIVLSTIKSNSDVAQEIVILQSAADKLQWLSRRLPALSPRSFPLRSLFYRA